MGPADEPALELLDLVLQLVDHTVEGTEGVGGRGLGPDDAAVAPQRGLADLLGRDPGIALLEEVDLGLLPPLVVSGEPGDLLLGGGPQAVGDLHVAASNRHFQERLLCFASWESMWRRL